MKKLLTYLFIFGFIIAGSAQEINNYKYVIIPETFEFTGEVDEYQLNSLTNFLFDKYGYNALMKTENKPDDLYKDPCLGLQTRLEDNSGIFVTKLVFKLLDCNERVVFQSKEGRSREKDYQAAYQEALRDAFSSFKEIDYVYTKTETSNKASRNSTAVSSNAKNVVLKNSEIEEIEEVEDAEAVEEIEESEIYEDIENKEKIEDETQVPERNKVDMEYQYSGKNYSLKETAQGLGLFQENSSEPIAILIETNKEKSYIYNSLTNQGIAYFDEKGNLIVEYFSRQQNKKLSLTYTLKN